MGFYIYGMGKNGVRMFLTLGENNIKVKGFIDRDANKIGSTFHGVKCFSLEDYLISQSKDDKVVVSIIGADNNFINYLVEKGIKKVINYSEIENKYKRSFNSIKDYSILQAYAYFYGGHKCFEDSSGK